MLRLKSLSLVNKRRTLRALYANTQAWPHACTLDTAFVRTSGQQLGLGTPAGMAAIFPGAPMQKLTGEIVSLVSATETNNMQNSNGVTNANLKVMGLSANYVGGTMDELGDFSEIGVWRGRGGTFEVLAPVFASSVSSLASLGAAFLTWNTSGQLSDVDNTSAAAVAGNAVARLIDNLSGSANAVIIELLVP